MANQEHHIHPPKIRLWPYLPLLIVLGLAVHLLLPQLTTLEHSWSVVKGMIWWAVILAAAAQVLSYLGSGYMVHAILESNGGKMSIVRGALIILASYSVGLVAGGWVGGAAATYNWVRRSDRNGNTAVLAGTLPALLNNGTLVAFSLIGIVFLFLLHDLTRTQLIEFGIILFVLSVIAGSVLGAFRYPETTKRAAAWVGSRWAKLRRKPFDPKDTAEGVDRFVFAWQSMGNGKWLHPALGSAANIGFDMLTLYFLFVAAGYNVKLGILFAGYGLPLLLGKMAFLIPGGVGVIEGSMVALYDSLKVPNAISVVVILGYRLFSFWIPSLIGFAAAAFLSRKTKNNGE